MESLPDEIVNKIQLYNSHPCADIIKQSFRDDEWFFPKFTYLAYFGFKPLTQSGTNGRQIHLDYDGYWSPWLGHEDLESDEEEYDAWTEEDNRNQSLVPNI